MTERRPRFAEFARRLRQLREEHNDTQGDMADKLEVSQSHVSQLHTGRIAASLKLLQKMSRVYGIDLQEWMVYCGLLVQGEDEIPSEERIAQRVAQLLGEKIEPSLEAALEVVATAAETGELARLGYEAVEEAEGKQFGGGTQHNANAREALDRIRRSLAAKRHPKQ